MHQFHPLTAVSVGGFALSLYRKFYLTYCGRYRYLGLIAQYLAVDCRYLVLAMCLAIPQIEWCFYRCQHDYLL
ncbi:hypothetical protein NA898_01790 [Proteus cibi]|uniref:Uncharacterized protein n=1 Tax=Proteus cibi TaxID=2050966 RepID=A0ABU6EE12_9GAMM|nr:hypothetical protein [Proteus cibi]MEB6856721.1 hypothetical protein [Proteus cibi]MEB7087285.1 hypothetical protein [Proteus cibi]